MSRFDLLSALILFPPTLLLIGVWWAWGAFTTRWLPVPEDPWKRFLQQCWVGFALATGFLQVWHLVFPLNATAALALLLPPALQGRTLLRTWPRGRWPAGIATASMALLAFVLLVWRFRNDQQTYDGGMYHLATVRWLVEYPIVPGLGNLNMQLGMNQTPFLWSAVCHLHPLWAHGHLVFHLALTLLAMLPGLRALSFRPTDAASLFALLQIPLLWFIAMGRDANLPAPDYAVAVLTVVAYGWLIEAWCDRVPSAPQLLFLLATLLTVKLSALLLALTAAAVWLVRQALTRRLRWRELLGSALLSTCVLAPWLLRGALLTGYPVFPSTIISVDADWTLPVHKVEFVHTFIGLWSRAPEPMDRSMVHRLDGWQHAVLCPNPEATEPAPPLPPGMEAGSPGWLGPWSRSMWAIRPVRFAVILLTVFVPLACWRAHRQLWLLTPPLAAILFWWLKAPNPRFGLPVLLLCATSAVALTLATLPRRIRTPLSPVLALAVTLGLFIQQGTFPDDRWRRELFPAHPRPALREVATKSGLILRVPVRGAQAFFQELPNTPFPNPFLELRDPEKGLRAGFRDATPDHLLPPPALR